MLSTPRPVPAIMALLACAAIVCLVAAAYVAVRAYRVESQAVAGSRQAVETRGWDGSPLETIVLRARDGSALGGWWVPSARGSVVLCTHGSGATRASLLPVMGLLTRHGFGVLALDWPGHGESQGAPDWGDGPIDVVRRAVDWLERRQTPPSHVAAYGFSMGAYFLARAAAAEPRLDRLVLEGCPTSISEQIAHEYGRWGPLAIWPAGLAVRQAGWNPAERDALASLAAAGRRPVLIIAGGLDPAVPPSMAREFAALGDHVELLEVPNASHGDALEKAPALYEETLVRFFSDASTSTSWRR